MILFLDLETTGLDPARHDVLEVAAIATDDALNVVATFERVIGWHGAQCMLAPNDHHLHDGLRDAYARHFDVHEKVVAMHTVNGLWEASAHATTSLTDADLELAAFIAEHGCEGGQLAGNSIHFDRVFMMRHLPYSLAKLHYRQIDITTLNEMMRRFQPRMYEHRPRPSDDASTHRALPDAQNSLDTARFYASRICDGNITGWA